MFAMGAPADGAFEKGYTKGAKGKRDLSLSKGKKGAKGKKGEKGEKGKGEAGLASKGYSSKGDGKSVKSTEPVIPMES